MFPVLPPDVHAKPHIKNASAMKVFLKHHPPVRLRPVKNTLSSFLDDDTAFHHKPHAPKLGDILKRIAFHGNQVGEFINLYSPD